MNDSTEDIKIEIKNPADEPAARADVWGLADHVDNLRNAVNVLDAKSDLKWDNICNIIKQGHTTIELLSDDIEKLRNDIAILQTKTQKVMIIFSDVDIKFTDIQHTASNNFSRLSNNITSLSMKLTAIFYMVTALTLLGITYVIKGWFF
jgi:hypothetical protein